MYNRYIRNDHGSYTRIPEEDGPPVPPDPGRPDSRLPAGDDTPPPGPPGERPQGTPPPGPPSKKPPGQSLSGRYSPPRGPGGVLRRLLDDVNMNQVDSGGLMLLGMLLLLAREGADEELLVALGLLLML